MAMVHTRYFIMMCICLSQTWHYSCKRCSHLWQLSITPINSKSSFASLEISMTQEICIYGGGTSPEILFRYFLCLRACQGWFCFCFVKSIPNINIYKNVYLVCIFGLACEGNINTYLKKQKIHNFDSHSHRKSNSQLVKPAVPGRACPMAYCRARAAGVSADKCETG